jgi:hypothetical protein
MKRIISTGLFLIFVFLTCLVPADLFAQRSSKNSPPVPSVEHPPYPPFYIWRRVSQKKGIESQYFLYRVNEEGSLILQKDIAPLEDWKSLRTTPTTRQERTKGTDQTENADMDYWVTCPSQKWGIQLPDSINEWGKFTLYLRDETTKKAQSVRIFGKGMTDAKIIDGGNWGWVAVGWHPKRDLFYFFTVAGDSTGRQLIFYQFDPRTKTSNLIGNGQKMEFSHDGNWIVWTDGFGGDWSTNQIHLYNIDKNQDYLVTSQRSDNFFSRWDTEGTDASRTKGPSHH